MIQMSTQQRGDLTSVNLAGSLDEFVDFASLLGSPQSGRFELVMKEITRINSQGIQSWIKYFSGLINHGVQVRLVECSTATVETLNQYQSFAAGMPVDSIYVPYFCSTCPKELLGLFKTADLKRLAFKVPELNCPVCKEVSQFDDLPQVYFFFLQRKGS